MLSNLLYLHNSPSGLTLHRNKPEDNTIEEEANPIFNRRNQKVYEIDSGRRDPVLNRPISAKDVQLRSRTPVVSNNRSNNVRDTNNVVPSYNNGYQYNAQNNNLNRNNNNNNNRYGNNNINNLVNHIPSQRK